MPETGVSDLRDVVDAINKLCDDMKTSSYDESYDDTEETGDFILSDPIEKLPYVEYKRVDPDVMEPAGNRQPETPNYVECRDTELVSPEEILVQRVETFIAERWSDSTSLSGAQGGQALGDTEPASEVYYTASSEVSLLSDLEVPAEESVSLDTKEERKECVIAGHVAAMREKFESMTRTNTPCPDLARSLSPSLDIIRNMTPSPDRLA